MSLGLPNSDAVGEARVELKERGDPSWVLASTFAFSKLDWQSCRKARGTPSMVRSDTGKEQSVTRTDQTEAEAYFWVDLVRWR